MVRIAEIQPGSIAEELELRVGTRIIRINGERVRDGLDFQFLSADSDLEIETVDPDGERRILDILREPDEAMGVVPAPDKIRECANECVFCFIDGNPEDVRESLWIRDDDFRLSFTYGSYVTLTNLGPRGLQRLVEQRLSPLYVSVHATEPDVRIRLLKNDRAGMIMDHLRYLTDAGLEVHTQVVLCPEWNDGEHLDRTIRDLYGLGAGVRSLSIVPVGLTKYNENRPVRRLERAEAAAAVDQVEQIHAQALSEREYRWCYAADELFLAAGRDLPSVEYYDDLSLAENGVGAVRMCMDRLDAELADAPSLRGRRIHVLTGHSMVSLLESRSAAIAETTGASVEIHAVENQFYGDSVTVAGLLSGGDLLAAARDAVPQPDSDDAFLIPAEALNQDDLFVDSLSLEELRRELAPACVATGYEIVETLRSL